MPRGYTLVDRNIRSSVGRVDYAGLEVGVLMFAHDS
jgi:hypothetical protein